jgi:hypothetical protein
LTTRNQNAHLLGTVFALQSEKIAIGWHWQSARAAAARDPIALAKAATIVEGL